MKVKLSLKETVKVALKQNKICSNRTLAYNTKKLCRILSSQPVARGHFREQALLSALSALLRTISIYKSARN